MLWAVLGVGIVMFVSGSVLFWISLPSEKESSATS